MFDPQKLQWNSSFSQVIYEQGNVKITFEVEVYHNTKGLEHDYLYTLYIGNDLVMESEKLNEIQSYLGQLD